MPDPVSGSPPSRRSLTLIPDDDRQFHEAALLAVELFPLEADGQGTSSTPRLGDDQRLLAAAQAMLRAAYPLATIIGDPRAGPSGGASPGGRWRVFRDPASLDDALLRAARSGDADALARLAGRYEAMAYLVAMAVCGEPAAAVASVTEAMGQLLRSDQQVEGERVADTVLRLARRSALSRTPSMADRDRRQAGAREQLSTLVARLPASQSAALSLAYAEGMSEAEVALALGLDEHQTHVLIRDGLAALVEAPA